MTHQRCYREEIQHLRPPALRQCGQQQRRRLPLLLERCLQVVDGVALVSPHRQTEAADQLPILDAVHVEGLPGVLLAGLGPRLRRALVLRE